MNNKLNSLEETTAELLQAIDENPRFYDFMRLAVSLPEDELRIVTKMVTALAEGK